MSDINEPAAVIKHGGTLADWQASTDRVPVFHIVKTSETEGEPDVVTDYTMPRTPNAGLALKYLKTARRSAPDLAMSWLIETAVGAEGYDALSDEPGLTSADLEAIVAKVQKIALGGLENPKGS